MLPLNCSNGLNGNFQKYIILGFHQDYAYVTLAKSKEQLLNKNWNLSLELLIILEKELHASNCNVPKLYKLISWEILLVQITQLIDEWPKNTIDKHALANACEVCLQTSDSVLPRTEIVEQCAVCLLNLGRWDFLINHDKRWTTFEITSAIALACQEIVKQKGNKKISKSLWDIVLPVFATSTSQSKRSNYHDISNIKSNLVSIFFKLKDSWCLTVVISLLTKLFNILKDESSLELHVDYANLWPNVISNAISYNAVAVCELLSEIVNHSLKEYPTNISWLRLMGDINFADQKTSNDAVDAYYHCFWDTSILEYLIHTHNKKGEFQRRKCAIQVIGLLELNSSNNEEIQREATNLRKSTFLRALCKQYVF
ncbi:hypothetical protein NQ314_018886 [Rhamnusium bicolor]|uniref:INTS8 TPR repeats domain-containing protein n=1 Tax=Rhamnusium bicolor TaxID=1586634 RepID=A0AAV8WQD8_9CUCU|nr:hypothetical protein NQ314_018886 [Rhamnusium bicolor]